MSDNRAIVDNADHALETLVAELTAAAYLVALRHGVGGKWLDLELDLWHVLAATVQKWDQRISLTFSYPENCTVTHAAQRRL